MRTAVQLAWPGERQAGRKEAGMEFRVLGYAAVEIDGQEIPLADRSRNVLACFLVRPRHCYAHEELGDALYEPGVRHTDNMVRQAVRRLRKSLGGEWDKKAKRFTDPVRDALSLRVETVKRGYR